ncbi:MAG TPA: SEC-C metal-binding domain-containing protein, partial [Terriglobia bacterium]|nr:SEC-C metal-binding domain-containing protein [Terriglobia bacterium]
PVDAKHLVGGTRIVGAAGYLVSMMFAMEGDVPECVLAGMKNTAVNNETAATGLLAMTIWCDEHRNGVFPPDLVVEARAVARRVKRVPAVDIFLVAIAQKTNDSVLYGIMRQNYSIISDAEWKKTTANSLDAAASAIKAYRTPVLQLLPTTPNFPLDPTTTVRRSVARLGRNEPCHCGSGKKYKNCHMDADRQRLQQSSGVAGQTLQEVHASPARHLTVERLEKSSGTELAHMDPLDVPRHLLTDYFVRLSMFNLDRAAEFLERIVAKSGYADDLEDPWFFIMFTAARMWRKDIGERMMKLRPDVKEEDLRMTQRLLMAQDEPGKSLTAIEEAAVKALKSDDPKDLIDIAYAVGFSKYGGLGVMIYRSILPLIRPKEMEQAYEQIKGIRERLKLPPEDPIHELVEARRDKTQEETEAALHEAEEKFEAKRREVRALRESIDQLQKDMSRRERAAAAEAAESMPSSFENEQRLREIRQKVKNLEVSLKEKNEETNILQKQLEEAQANVETLRAQASSAAAGQEDEADREEDLLLPQDAEGSHPVRLIEFPRGFHDRLAEFPHHVARGAMVMLGRLAGGDTAAFSGAKRLKSRPNVVRQRIGIDFRLLFRLLPDRIQVIDLIPRQDFERKIKTLT